MQKSPFQKMLKNHSLAMILCCAIPLTLFVILSFTGSLGSWGYYGLMLLCPLLHILMMRGNKWTSEHVHAHVQPADEAERHLLPPPPEKDLQGMKKGPGSNN